MCGQLLNLKKLKNFDIINYKVRKEFYMGTNYYVVPNRPSVAEPIHIGKSSCGWMFLFQEINSPWFEPPIVWHTYEQVIDWLQRYTVDTDEYVILDEYDRVVSLEELEELIKEKQITGADNPNNFTFCKNVNGYRFTMGEFS